MAQQPLTRGDSGKPGRDRGAQGTAVSARRLLGIDRSGPPPPQTLADAPLNPWTLPNAVGFVRLALIPVFLVVAFSSDDGQSTSAAVLFAVIGWGDYLDGFVARLTGQYSRLGALLDPVIDRGLVISGMAVAWHFTLLPHWAIALVVAREVFMLAIGRYGLHRGLELRINWAGRLGVAPTMGAPFFAMVGLGGLALAMLYLGLALSLTATVLYVRSGMIQLRARQDELSTPDKASSSD